MAMISIKNLCKNYGENIIFNDFNLDIYEGETLAILGESGSGKTTLLNVLAGLTDFEGQVLGIEKPISMVFQRDMLVKNLTVEQNLLLINKDIKVDEILGEVGLKDKKDEYIKNLSGGMARRVAIARALVAKSNTLFLDEPFINLDLSLKFSLMDIIKRKKKQKTIILVTHDIKESVYLADRIVVLSKGKIVLECKNQKDESEKIEKKLFETMISL